MPAKKKRSTTAESPEQPPSSPTGFRENLGRSTIPPILHSAAERERLGMKPGVDDANSFVIELNLAYHANIVKAAEAFTMMFHEMLGHELPNGAKHPDLAREPELLSKTYLRCDLTIAEMRELVRMDEMMAEEERAHAEAEDRAKAEESARLERERIVAAGGTPPAAEPPAPPRRKTSSYRCIYKLWPDFPVHTLVDRSVATVKADAARRSFAASGAGIVWAVVDTGINAAHVHFGDVNKPLDHTLLHPSVIELHRDFTGGTPVEQQVGGAGSPALDDPFGHGTHVAGIIAGGIRKTGATTPEVQVFEQVFELADDLTATKRREERHVDDVEDLHGVAPDCRLVSLRVLDDNGSGRTSDVIRALQYIREEVNGDPKLLRVHGVNLSIGYEFNAEMFACGQSPLCVEVNRLVRSGVVVVVAAGNTGYGTVTASERPTNTGLATTINDPGNAALAITVGATHRDSPHTYGVSYFSSKGPTGDGRLKPDIVAPGERITSCVSPGHLKRLGLEELAGENIYLDDSGTSMAAPHVSGAIAAFLSIRREFVLQPDEVKKIFLDSATPLGRERYFEGHGLVDLMRAIQSV